MSSNNANMRQTPLTCSGHTRPVVDLAFSEMNPNDDAAYYCISACKDGKPMLRQGDTGDWIGTFEGHKGAVWGVDLNHDASKAATGAADFSAKVWDAVKGEEELTLQHKHIVKSVNFSPVGGSNLLATASNDKLLRIFDLEKPSEPVLTFKGHTSGIRQVLFATDNESTLVSGADDKTLRSWDARSGEETRKIEVGVAVGGIELSRAAGILTIAAGKKVIFCDAKSLDKIKEVDIPCPVNSASLNPDRKIFVCGGDDCKMYKYDYESGAEIESFKGHFGPVHCVRFSPDGELYASGSEDGTLRLWQTEVGKTYGLWRCVDSVAASDAITNSASKAEAVAS